MYDEMCLDTFLKEQGKLFRDPVAETPEEADQFLEDCMAVVCENIKEVRAYFEEEGMDIAEMGRKELQDADEVFELPDGRYLVVL